MTVFGFSWKIDVMLRIFKRTFSETLTEGAPLRYEKINIFFEVFSVVTINYRHS